MQEKREKLREELFSQTKRGFHYLGNSQPIQIAKYAKSMKFTVREMNSEYEGKGVAGQLLAITSK